MIVVRCSQLLLRSQLFPGVSRATKYFTLFVVPASTVNVFVRMPNPHSAGMNHMLLDAEIDRPGGGDVAK